MSKRTEPEYRPATGNTNTVDTPQAQHNQQHIRSIKSLPQRRTKSVELTSETLEAQIAAFKAAGGEVDVIETKTIKLATRATAE
ncbi:MAG: hypothetical protein HRU20_29310 [Pseudomonadales bacterium]|nr:hypothetical protein [Pseudomonadales bacterium]